MEQDLEILSKSIQFGEAFLKELEKKTDLKLEDKIIIALYRKLLEQADSCYVLADHNLDGPLTVMKRTIFETYLSLRYILQEEKSITLRAHSYYVGFLKDAKIDGEDWISQRKVDISDLNIEHDINGITEILNSPLLKNTIKEWEDTKTNFERKFKRKYNPKWYSLYNGPTSIKALSNKLMQNEVLVYKMYGSFSQEAHGYKALDASNKMELIDKPLVLKPIRSHIDPSNIGVCRSLLTGAMFEVVCYLLPDRLEDCVEFADTIGMKAEINK
ncbi:DUF5677 domain-containing protein [Bacillus cereus group sp. TH243-1LC]|uniref:DUF5677 domain-containing protein n=1 Tax=Bacillus cereus group sp. TH243-1LC TaxID=3018046 RepID=UPI0022E708A2|nr:DUF5677 domain-containing protein [Bacillus cereus group sp. TH243-1LC]MDA1564046.1 DUF5677 domain-containing protein [Bacillus cereus group sp. TH243-1LC]